MSGRHARPRRQPGRWVLRFVRVSLRRLRPVGAVVAGGWAQLAEVVTKRWKARFGDDVWDSTDSGCPACGGTGACNGGPCPLLNDDLPAPVEEPQKTAQGSLTAEQALRVLHGQHPHLPGAHVRWHLFDGAVAGEVHALDADEEGQREIVGQYAAVLAAEMSEHPDGSHVIVAVVGAFADVAFTVAAVLIHDDTMPLPVFDEAAADPTVGDATLTTQHIPERVLAEVVGAR